MTTRTYPALVTMTSAADEPRRRAVVPWTWQPLVGVVALLALFGSFAFIPSGFEGERAALARMPAAERGTLFESTRQSAETICGASEHEIALVDQCRELALFIQAFSECDDDCRALGRAHQRRPVR